MAEQRVTLTLPESLVDYLRQEAERSKNSMAEVVRNSITKAKTIQEQTKNSKEITIQVDDGKLKTLVFPE